MTQNCHQVTVLSRKKAQFRTTMALPIVSRVFHYSRVVDPSSFEVSFFFSFIYLFFNIFLFFMFLGPHPWHMEVPSLGAKSVAAASLCHSQIRATSVTYATAHGNARSLIH